MPALVRVAAIPMSVKLAAPGDWTSTRIAVASGALFDHVRFTCVDDAAVACKLVGAGGSPCRVEDATSFE